MATPVWSWHDSGGKEALSLRIAGSGDPVIIPGLTAAEENIPKVAELKRFAKLFCVPATPMIGALLLAAPDLLAACQAQNAVIELLFAMLVRDIADFRPSKSGPPWEALIQGNAAIAKAMNRQAVIEMLRPHVPVDVAKVFAVSGK